MTECQKRNHSRTETGGSDNTSVVVHSRPGMYRWSTGVNINQTDTLQGWVQGITSNTV